MKRRLTIAVALIHKSRMVFLDEPTTGLDVQSSRVIRALLKKLNESGVTIFLMTHYIEEADQLCQRIAIINQGKIVALDSPEKLKAKAEEQHVVEVSETSLGFTLRMPLKLFQCSLISAGKTT
jgi:ABC-2 type transport system ATP-binding protein